MQFVITVNPGLSQFLTFLAGGPLKDGLIVDIEDSGMGVVRSGHAFG